MHIIKWIYALLQVFAQTAAPAMHSTTCCDSIALFVMGWSLRDLHKSCVCKFAHVFLENYNIITPRKQLKLIEKKKNNDAAVFQSKTIVVSIVHRYPQPPIDNTACWAICSSACCKATRKSGLRFCNASTFLKANMESATMHTTIYFYTSQPDPLVWYPRVSETHQRHAACQHLTRNSPPWKVLKVFDLMFLSNQVFIQEITDMFNFKCEQCFDRDRLWVLNIRWCIDLWKPSKKLREPQALHWIWCFECCEGFLETLKTNNPTKQNNIKQQHLEFKCECCSVPNPGHTALRK